MTRLSLLAHMRLDQIPSGFTTRSYFRNHDWTSNFRIRFGSNVKRRSCWETVGISDPPAQTRRTPHTAPGYGYPSVRIPIRTDTHPYGYPCVRMDPIEKQRVHICSEAAFMFVYTSTARRRHPPLPEQIQSVLHSICTIYNRKV